MREPCGWLIHFNERKKNVGILTSDPGSFRDTRLMADIQVQPESLAEVLAYYCKDGEKLLTLAADLLKFAERVVVTGMGASLYAAVGLELELSRLGIPSSLRETAELLHYQDRLREGTFFLVVSRSGETVEVVKLANKIRAEGCSLIAVTNRPTSSLATLADLVLPVPSRPEGEMAIQSYTSTVLALILLASRIRGDLEESYRVLEPLVIGLPGYFARMLKEAPRWDDFFDARLPVYFLARGPSSGSAAEAAMLWNETAKHPAFAMTAGNFRHGHIELVDQAFRAVTFASGGRTRALNIGLAEKILSFGGKAAVIGAGGVESGVALSIATLPVSETFAPLVEIVPIQLAAARLAALKGLPVGALRHAQPVTRDEIAF